MNLEGKVALVTGGGSGIGFGIARVLASHGASLVLAQRHLESVEAAAAALEPTPVLAVEVDIRRADSVERMMEQTMAHFGRIDILVNNASVTGLPAIAGMLDCSPGQTDDIVDINLKGTFYCSQAAARRMIAAESGGSIVHISSVGAYASQELASLYCATKAAQVALARSMALELAAHRIRVNCVAPGDIPTEASARITQDATGPVHYQRVTPLPRIGTPQDIGNAVAYLASDEAAFVTGATLIVDGGFLTY
ncbi:MAG: SDR family NAD(P)-dependent oxidoreductase [Candidatus Sulfotelmatobacter sp.]